MHNSADGGSGDIVAEERKEADGGANDGDEDGERSERCLQVAGEGEQVADGTEHNVFFSL